MKGGIRMSKCDYKNCSEKLDAAIDDLHYALTTGSNDNRVFYIQNAIRFIGKAKELLK
jgi:hypothetical protein